MNMTLSKRGDYVMRSAIALARAYETGGPRKIREVVAQTEVPRTFASQILADLVRAGLATSRAGRDGGYRLSRPPEEISVLEVVEAAEGPLRAERCALGEGPCRWEAVCPLHETWGRATSRLAELLAGTTLAEVAARDADIEAGRYRVPADAHRSHAGAVELSDLVHVELPALAVHRALGGHHSWSAVLGAAVHEAGELQGGTPSEATRLVAECSIDAAPRTEGADPAVYVLGWRLSEPGGRSHFEGELRVEPLDADRCELQVSGTWHQAVGDGTPLDTDALGRRARRVVRALMRRVARELDDDSRLLAATPGGFGLGSP
ncbi:MAG: Rrf2 family transcriptional regulator [Actinomycetota bacterium]|nr:Rrf2 family transcriptional regulator [Actinomycetota bacterium]